MEFHKEYSNLINQLLLSILKNIYFCLTTCKKNPLSIEEIQSINPIVENYLKHEIEIYNHKKQRNRKPSVSNSMRWLSDTKAVISNFIPIYTEEEFNLRVKDIIDNLYKKIAKSHTELFQNTIKKYIRDGMIYDLIHELEVIDGKLYPNNFYLDGLSYNGRKID